MILSALLDPRIPGFSLSLRPLGSSDPWASLSLSLSLSFHSLMGNWLTSQSNACVADIHIIEKVDKEVQTDISATRVTVNQEDTRIEPIITEHITEEESEEEEIPRVSDPEIEVEKEDDHNHFEEPEPKRQRTQASVSDNNSSFHRTFRRTDSSRARENVTSQSTGVSSSPSSSIRIFNNITTDPRGNTYITYTDNSRVRENVAPRTGGAPSSSTSSNNSDYITTDARGNTYRVFRDPGWHLRY